MRKLAAELLGTFWLVFGGCGSAVISAAFPGVGVGLLGVALAFGVTVLTMDYAIGHISGCHLNPAVTLGLCAGGRFPAKEVVPYWAAQVAGAILAAALLLFIASGSPGYDIASNGLAQNGYGDGGGLRLRGRAHRRLHPGDPRLDRQPRAGGFRADRNRARADLDPPRQHPGDQHVGEPGAEHRTGAARRRYGASAIVDVLGRAAGRRGDRGPRLSGIVRRSEGTARYPRRLNQQAMGEDLLGRADPRHRCTTPLPERPE